MGTEGQREGWRRNIRGLEVGNRKDESCSNIVTSFRQRSLRKGDKQVIKLSHMASNPEIEQQLNILFHTSIYTTYDLYLAFSSNTHAEARSKQLLTTAHQCPFCSNHTPPLPPPTHCTPGIFDTTQHASHQRSTRVGDRHQIPKRAVRVAQESF